MPRSNFDSEDCPREFLEKFGWKRITTEGVAFLKFHSHVNENEKKIVKIKKSKIFLNCLEIWWIATFPQDLTLIPLTVSEKTRTTDGRPTTDVRATAIALLTQSSRAKN